MMTPELFRVSHFPQFAHQSYLATCSLSPYTPLFITAGQRMLDAMQSDRLAWPAFEDEVHTLRQRIARLIGAHTTQIALMPNASIGAYQVASTLAWRDRPGIAHAGLEFPSIAHVWLAQAARGARPVAVDCTGSHDRIVAAYRDAIGADTHLVSVPFASYLEGKRLPVMRIGAMARKAGARLFVDAYQALGVATVDVDALGCDYLVGGFMKYLLGLPGVAFLYVRDVRGNDLDPQLTGWFGRRRPFDFDAATLDYPDTAARFETGTPPVPAVYAANMGLSMVSGIGAQLVEAHVAALVGYAAERLFAGGEELLHAPVRDEHGAHVALRAAEPDRLSDFLRKHEVIVSPRGNAIRLSFHYFNLKDDVDRLCAALQLFRTTSTT